MADLAKEIGRHLPYLRRYARAITGEQGTGDRTVKAALERLLAERPSDLDDNPRLALYRSLHDVLRGGQAAAGGAGEGEHLPPTAASWPTGSSTWPRRGGRSWC